MQTPARPDEDDGASATELLLEKGIAGARVLLLRGFALRGISVTTNVALIALVLPSDLGLLAVVRGAFGLIEFGSELGFQLALIRRRAAPTREELASLVGFRTIVLLVLVLIGALAPSARTLFGTIPAGYGAWMMVALAALLVAPIQSVCKVMLERNLEFARMSVVDLTGISLQNVALVAFALVGHVREGIFAVQALMPLYYTVALLRAYPISCFSVNLQPLVPLLRDGFGFSTSAFIAMARDSLTPLLIGKLFGLHVVGLWSFASRVGQFLQFTLEGYFRAGIAVTGRLASAPRALRRFATAILEQVASITYPVVALLVATLPLLGVWFERWQPAVAVAQPYVLALGVFGVGRAALWPVAISRYGSRIAVMDELLPLLVVWVGLFGMAVAGRGNIGAAFAAGVIVSWAYLVWVTERGIRPELTPAFRRSLAVLVCALMVVWVGSALGGGVVLVSALGSVLPGLVLLYRIVDWAPWASVRPRPPVLRPALEFSPPTDHGDDA